MNYEIINTGSDGNCLYLNIGILLDIGVAYKRVKKYLDKTKLIFVSHSHSDHLKPSTIKKIAYEYPNVKFLVGKQLVQTLVQIGVRKKSIFALDLEKWYDVGLCKVKLDYLYHDIPNYAIHIDYKSYKLIYVTDTGKVEHIKAENYDYALVEANYTTDEELEEQIKIAREKGEYTHLIRVKETHLSQLQALNWLNTNNIVNYRFIHEHKEKINEKE